MSDNLWIREEYVEKRDDGKCYLTGDTDVYETWASEPGPLFRSLQREYGRCTGRVHIDQDGSTLSIGWVFEKRRKFDDCNETFLQETWVTLHTAPPTKTIKFHYREL